MISKGEEVKSKVPLQSLGEDDGVELATDGKWLYWNYDNPGGPPTQEKDATVGKTGIAGREGLYGPTGIWKTVDMETGKIVTTDAPVPERGLEWASHVGPAWQAEPQELPITAADVWADFSTALELDGVQPFDAAWKSIAELVVIAAASDITVSYKTMQEQTKRAVEAGRMERQWQMRETTAGPRRVVVFRVVGVKGGK